MNFTDADARVLRQVINREQTKNASATNPRIARYPSDFVRLLKAPSDGVPAATYDQQTQTLTAGFNGCSPQKIELDDQATLDNIIPCDDPEEEKDFNIKVYNFVQKKIEPDVIFAAGKDAFGNYIVLHEQPKLELCRATQVGGSQGTSSTQASWTYDIESLETGESLLTAADVNTAAHPYERPDAGQMKQATFGIVYTGSVEVSGGTPPPSIVYLNEALITCPPETP
jgi:hypothetical protein